MASLRQVTAHHAHDQRLTDLVGQLTVHSDEFTTLWKHHPVRTCTSGEKHLNHPTAGPFTNTSATLPPPQESIRA
ncbi:hypothetical protein ACFZC3_04135 [Streptomyces sp. NPDC007903]|uniref:MmyB family transcriptional regulator n=1 Tax=Streptomyces sp. NPDC007903 TaxID=3364786 RepID=UPI0036EDCDE1